MERCSSLQDRPLQGNSLDDAYPAASARHERTVRAQRSASDIDARDVSPIGVLLVSEREPNALGRCWCKCESRYA